MSKNNKNKELQNNIKVILLGEAGVGKTSIILRYIQNKFNPSQTSTFGATYLIKDIERGNNKYKLYVWDTTGQEKYHSVTKLFVQNANIVILVYSINDINSFKALDYWRKTIKEMLGDNFILAIAGNKYDLINSMSEEEVEKALVPEEKVVEYAKENDSLFKLVSAKEDGVGINGLFDMVVDAYLNKNKGKNVNENDSIQIDRKKNRKKDNKKSCCS